MTLHTIEPTVIIGAGFTGLFAALHLRHQSYIPEILLIDQRSQFVFKPMLYELLTEELTEGVICPSYAELLKGSNISFVQGDVTRLNLSEKVVELGTGEVYHYSNLVLGVGCVQGYLGTEGAEEHSFAFRSPEEAIVLQEHLKKCLQESLATTDASLKQALLTFAIVGAGPSGVEMAATLADVLPRWYALLGGNPKEIKIVLINHATEILAGDANARLQKDALEALNKRTIPVELKLGIGVKSVTKEAVGYQKKDAKIGETIQFLATHTTIWTAGSSLNPLIESLHSQLAADQIGKHGQLLVTHTLQLPNFPEVFAAGDCVEVQGQSQPALAQVAYQQGAAIAYNLIALKQGKNLHDSTVTLRGTLMKLGLSNGVANLFDKVQIHGKPADLIRRATYLEMLPTPLHNFKATKEWLKEETFNRYLDGI